MMVRRLRSYVAVVIAGSRRAIRDPATTIVVLRTTPPRPSRTVLARLVTVGAWPTARRRSEEHTSELQSLTNLVCRLLLGKKKGVLPFLTVIVGTGSRM